MVTGEIKSIKWARDKRHNYVFLGDAAHPALLGPFCACVTTVAIISAKVNIIPSLERQAERLLSDWLSTCLEQFTREFEVTLCMTIHFL